MVKAVPDPGSLPRTGRKKAAKEEVREGLLLLEHAIRMRLRNRIVVDTLTADGAVDVDSWRRAAQRTVGGFRAETEASARRIDRKLTVVRDLLGEGDHEHDYRADDVENLRRRRRIHRRLGRRLRRWEDDPVRIEALLAAARADAWGEIDTEIRRLVTASEAVDPADESVLRDRLRMIAEIDLPALARARSTSDEEG